MTPSHSTTEWPNITDMPLTTTTHNHNSDDLKYDLTPKQRTSLNQTNDYLDVQVYVQIRVTRLSPQTRAPRHSQTRSKHSSPHRSRANDLNKPFGNPIVFVGIHSHCRMTERPLRFQLPGAFTSKNEKEMMLAKYKRPSCILHYR